MADDIQLHGLKELQATLRQLPLRLQDRTILAALRAAGQVIRKEAQARVPLLKQPVPHRKRGVVRKAISVRRSRLDNIKGKRSGVYIGVKPLGRKEIKGFKGGTGRNPDDPFYWIFLEFGTSKMSAKPFLRPAFEAKQFEALRKFEEYMKARVEKEAAKLARQLGLAA